MQTNKITLNTATANRYGIYLYGGEDCLNNSVSNNTVNYNFEEGVYIRSTQKNKISNNTCSFNEYNGILLGSSNARNNSVWNNICNFYSKSGILLNGGSLGDFCGNNTIHRNNCSFNQEYGIFIRIGTNNKLWYNYLGNNTVTQGYDGWWSYNALQNQWDNSSTGNYWGDYQARYPASTNDGTVWNSSYTLGGYSGSIDHSPLVIQVPLSISQPSDVVYECNTKSHVVSWTLVDTTVSEPTYAIYQNGNQFLNQTWTSGMPVSINVNDLALGTYNYTIIAVDGRGDRVEDQVNVTVVNAPPTLPSPPGDFNLECNVTGTKIQWMIFDVSVFTPTYEVYRNGSSQINQTWASGVAIAYLLEGIPIGEYNFTIAVTDG